MIVKKIDNWKFLINKLLIFLGMIATFMGATLGYTEMLLKNLGKELYITVLTMEMFAITIAYFILIVTIIDFIKDNRIIKKD
jgi:hypothetical protein